MVLGVIMKRALSYAPSGMRDVHAMVSFACCRAGYVLVGRCNASPMSSLVPVRKNNVYWHIKSLIAIE